MDTEQCIHKAKTVRYYTSDPVPEDVILSILEAGRASGSGKNMQLWHFILVRDRDHLKQLSMTGRYSAHFADAAFGVVILTAENPMVPQIAWFDAGRAAQNMILAARAHGVGSCPVGFREEPETAKAILGVPDDRIIVIGIAFGYPDRGRVKEELEFQVQVLAQRSRKPISEVASENRFGEPLKLVALTEKGASG